MHAFVWRSFALLIGLSAIIHALTIPVAYENALTLRQEAPTDFSSHADVERRDPKGGKKTPTKPRPSPVLNKKPASSPAKSPSKASTSSPAKPTGRTSTKKTAASATASASASGKPIAPLPFTFIKPSKKAVNVCDLAGFECSYDDLEPESSTSEKPAKSRKVVKRDPSTPYKGEPGDSRHYKVKFEPKALILESKAYWTGPDLYDNTKTNLNLKKVYADFKSDNIDSNDAYKVKATSRKPAGNSIFVTEHILELQTIKKFIESVTQTEDEYNPKLIKLRKTVESEWFSKEWKKRYPARVRDRPKPVTAYPRPSNPKDESINDIVFEALGSKTNADDFVLCERSINSAKGRLWSNLNPYIASNVKRQVLLAASGFIDSNEHMSVIRTVLAVYEYMELSEVKTRLEREIEHVKTELSKENIKFIVHDNIPKDKVRNEDVDLAEMWEEYMAKHIVRFERIGVDWLQDQLENSLKLYQVGLKDLEDAEKEMAKEKATRNVKQRQKLTDERVVKANLLKKNAKILQRNLKDAEKHTKAEEDKFLAIKARVDALDQDKRPTERKNLKFFQQVTRKTAAIEAEYNKQVKYGRAQREIIGLDEKELPVTIKQVRADVNQLKAFQAVVKKMDDDLKVKEVGLDLGGISIDERDAATFSF